MSVTTVDIEHLLSKPEVCRILNISGPTLERLLVSRAIRKVKLGRAVRIRPSDLNAYIESLTDDPTPIRKSS